MEKSRKHNDPSWWSDTHNSAWERTKEALHRDWEQTKADLSKGGQELNQDAGDTLKQAAGKQAIPPGDRPNPVAWTDAEPAVRYGYGARHHYQGREWGDDLERDLEKDWGGSGESSWDQVKHAVRRGWNSAKRAVT
jgi:hypothetical protein